MALEQREYTGHPPVRVDAATDDRRAVAARTDGSPRAASDQDRAMTRLMNRGDLSDRREGDCALRVRGLLNRGVLVVLLAWALIPDGAFGDDFLGGMGRFDLAPRALAASFCGILRLEETSD